MSTVTITGLSFAAAFGPGAVSGSGSISSIYGKGDLVADDAVGVAAAIKVFGKVFLPDFSLDCDPDPPKLTPPDGPLDCEFADDDLIEMVNISVAIFDLTRVNWKLKGYRSVAWSGSACLGAGVTKVVWRVTNVRGP